MALPCFLFYIMSSCVLKLFSWKLWFQDSDEDANAAKRDNFVEDPAVLRQRAEERARYKAGRAKPSQAPKTHDVKGGPKGQGQSSEVLRNRKWKTQHKGDFRRAAADRKRKV
jgi:activating signal cointegrator complex subunit 2